MNGVSEMVDIVDALENKVSKLLHKMQRLRQHKTDLEKEVRALKSANETAQQTARAWEEKYNALKLAESMLGSEDNKREAKLKINALIRELDHCIVQLAE